ncbi:MAG: 4Fe-4S binding protein [Candidatus Hydrogenedentes bacterium]|nr:4Fe-4S binding protein [Candidatus Hydrogenedentota bacterium]
MATCGLAGGAGKLFEAIREQNEKNNYGFFVAETGCNGACFLEPLVDVVLPGQGRITYANMKPSDIENLLLLTFGGRVYTKKAVARATSEHLLSDDTEIPYLQGVIQPDVQKVPPYSEAPFFKNQVRIALRNCGIIDPTSLDEYIAFGGYAGAAKALTQLQPEDVIDEIKRSGLRGRGGGGFPTGRKWEACRKANGAARFVICNADEGDPGAYMDRSIIEGDPHSIIEGMIIGAYAIGARIGYVYVREEYPLAVKRMRLAVQQAEAAGLLGENIFGSGFDFRIRISRGAGAFVCGEETGLIASIEGNAGTPRQRPPYPAQSGLWGMPTNINNVETWNNVPVIITRGAGWFSSIGTPSSKGTKVFSLVGKAKRVGLVEVPMGTSLREVVEQIGGGIQDGGEFKALQTGGPSGGCIPAAHLDCPVDYETLTSLGSMMGSGGMIVMDSRTCMVEMARYFLAFLKEESCGKCVPCREGTLRMLETLSAICEGRGRPEHLDLLKELSEAMADGSLCALGGSAPNPVRSTLHFFEEEYRAHIEERRCPARVCKALIEYQVVRESCTGCGACARVCPVKAAFGKKKAPHEINNGLCTRCGLCADACKFKAIKVA